MHSCWVEVDLGALRHNYRALQQFVGDQTGIIAVVKANAYGHGAVEVSRLFADEGAVMLAVTRLDEALPLRQSGITAAILLLAPPLPDECDEVVAQNLTACVTSLEDAVQGFEKNLLQQLFTAYPSTRQLAARLNTSHTAIGQRLRKYGISR